MFQVASADGCPSSLAYTGKGPSVQSQEQEGGRQKWTQVEEARITWTVFFQWAIIQVKDSCLMMRRIVKQDGETGIGRVMF